LEDGSGRFEINMMSGRVSSILELDREDVDSYTLIAMATDAGSLPHSSTVTVTVSVLDANDNSPMFEKSSYNVYIKNPTVAGELIRC
jgi:RNA:NAD 2'-phosphotransferase (TPT1/KptA family)